MEPAPERSGLRKARLIGAALEICGGIILVVTLVCVFAWAFFASQERSAEVREYFVAVALALAGVASGLLLWGASEIIRKLDDLLQTVQDGGESLSAPVAAGPAPRAASGAASVTDAALSELVPLMREIRDIALLNEKQREQRLETQGRELIRRLEAEVPALLREHNWVEARARVQKARERVPSLPQWDVLTGQIEKVRAEVETHDVEAATRQVNDLASLGAWDRANDVVRDLLQRHPGSQPADGLAARVADEREKAQAEERGRLMARAQNATNRHEWIEALSIANSIIQKYPDSADAEAIRAQLPTLEANVEIQRRQRAETEYKGLVEQHRYAEALRVARSLIERYPDSPQADVLRQQLPKLEEKASSLGATV
ncbi:MAG: tetratricopeptide repeat protein [Planctomycetes bacterium]|nr:tetratricopeptide repeat protein [Planctomycetota bacterium]